MRPAALPACGLLLLLLWPGRPALGRQLAQATDGVGTGEGCQAKLNYSTVAMPPEAKPLWRIFVTGTRNYTCQTQTLSFGPSLGVGNITGQLANGTAFTCDWFYNSAFSAIVACRTNGSTEEFGYSLDTTVRGAVFVLPAPGSGDEPWGRFKISSTGAMAPANYVVRTNTTGGLRPEQCDAPAGEWLTVPYSGAGEGYLCL